jgi:hypothetical protein
MKIFTYLRTLWHEFWIWYHFGPSDSAENATPARKKPKLQPSAVVQTSSKLTELFGNSNHWPFEPEFPTVPLPKPTKKLWVYNASRVAHVVDNPKMGSVTIPANDTSKRYVMWTSFPDIMVDVRGDIDHSYITTMRGEEFVNDLIKGGTNGYGRDLSVKGVFWSYNNPPLVREVNAAVKPMANHYKSLMEKAAIIWANAIIDEARVLDMMRLKECSMETAIRVIRSQKMDVEITPEMHAAAEFFKTTTPWHTVLFQPNIWKAESAPKR